MQLWQASSLFVSEVQDHGSRRQALLSAHQQALYELFTTWALYQILPTIVNHVDGAAGLHSSACTA